MSQALTSVAAVRTCEHGAILVQVAVMLVVLMGMVGFVVDYGALWTARAQAQNAADAGALAGATALAFDASVGTTAEAVIASNGIAAATQNSVWGSAPTVPPPLLTVNDASCNIPNVPAPPSRVVTCVTVSVYRNGEQGSAKLPTFFTRLLGVANQGVKAQAVATAVPANVSHCVWPIAIPDKWTERSVAGGWNVNSTFDIYSAYPALLPAATLDAYTAPSASALGTGFFLSSTTLAASPSVTLSLSMIPNFAGPIHASQFVPVQIPGASFTTALSACSGTAVHIGQDLTYDAGAASAQVITAGQQRYDLDSAARWDAPSQRLLSSCAATASCGVISPRTVLVPLFDPYIYETTRWPAGNTPRIHVTNFVGLVIDSRPAATVTGDFTTFPGDVDTSQPQVGYLSGFLRAAVLSR